jgi:hypothetical protein
MLYHPIYVHRILSQAEVIEDRFSGGDYENCGVRQETQIEPCAARRRPDGPGGEDA